VRWIVVLLLAVIGSGCSTRRHIDPAPLPRWMEQTTAGSPSDGPGVEPSAPPIESAPADSAPGDAPSSGADQRGEGTARRISLGEALGEALSGNVDLALSRAEREVAAARLEVNRGTFLPFLELGAGYSRTQDRVQGSFGELMDVDFDSYVGAVGFGWRFNLGADRHSVEAAEHEASSAGYEVLDAERRLLLGVAELYEKLALAAELVEVAERLVGDGEELLAIAEERERAGVGTGGDVALARTDLARVRQQAVTAHSNLETQSVRLANVLSVDPAVLLDPSNAIDEPWTLLGASTAIDPGVVLANRPDVAAARLALEATVSRTEEADARVWAPDLLVGVEQRYLGDSSQDIAPGSTYGASLRWTFSGPGLRRVREREAEERAARVQLVGRQQDALAELRTALQDVERTGARLPLAQQALAASEDHVEIQRERFRAGTALALEVVQAQGLHAQSRADLAANIVAHNLAQARLLAATGMLDRSTLSSPAAPPTGDPEDQP